MGILFIQNICIKYIINSNSKVTTNKTYTLCVNPTYMNPQMVLGQGYDYRCDLWSLGIFIYELLNGKTPFEDDNCLETEIYHNIISHSSNLPCPKGMPKQAMDLVNKLLKRNPSNRLGDGSIFLFILDDGIKKLKSHPWFSNIDWNIVNNLDYESPIKKYAEKEYNKIKKTKLKNKIDFSEYSGDLAWVLQF